MLQLKIANQKKLDSPFAETAMAIGGFEAGERQRKRFTKGTVNS